MPVASVTCQARSLQAKDRADFFAEHFGNQALKPRPGISCKAIFASPGTDLDAQAAAWLRKGTTPRDLAPLPVFGYPGWTPAQDEGFYEDPRYFRQGKAG